MKYYVVADVHGYYSLLRNTLKEKGFFDDKEPHKLVICGDVLDRGEEPKEMQRFLKQLIKTDEVILIRGNHEDLILELAEDLYKGNVISLFGAHRSNGTRGSLLGLANSNLIEASHEPKLVAKKFYKTGFYKEIIPKMVNYYETKNYIFVHGWIPCLEIVENGEYKYVYKSDWRDSDSKSWDEARWINGMYAASLGVIEPKKTIICGHWHTSYGHSVLEGNCSEFGNDADYSPYYAKGVIGLDACTAYSGQMNCIVIDD